MVARYQMIDSADYKLQALDAISILFHRTSGTTHIVADPMPQIIEVMGSDCLSAAEIEQRLQKLYAMELPQDTEETETFEQIITARLEEFVALGLVQKTN